MALSNSEKTKRYREKKYAEIERMDKVPCACGCGTMIAPVGKQLKPVKYALGHNPGGEETRFTKGQDAWNKGKPAPWATETHTGKKLSPETLDKRKASRLKNNNGVYQYAGWKYSPEGLARITEINRSRDQFGEKNHFFGKRHTKETRALISLKNSGEKNAHWRGGVSTLPYGHEFTYRFKRLIRERDQYTCQRCGITQGDLHYTIHVHHLNFDKMNNDPTNLVCACAKCNIWANLHTKEVFINQEVWDKTHS